MKSLLHFTRRAFIAAPHSLMNKLVPFVVFAVFLGLWTWKLLEANPVPETLTQGWSLDLKFLASKVLHVAAYGFLTLLAAWLPVSQTRFRWVIALLMMHAIVTEIGQSYVPNRHGSPIDVGFDWLGIALALALLWIIRRPSSATPSPRA
jgi:hypothetical protein